MKYIAIIVCAVALISSDMSEAGLDAGSTARYLISAGPAQVTEAWVIVEDSEEVDGKPYIWWRLVMRKGDGQVLAVRALSESVPMTSPDAPGNIARYMYSPRPGEAFEYVDKCNDRALLPEIDITHGFLPTPSVDARYSDGLASTGEFLGHMVRKASDASGCPDVDFDSATRLAIRTDLVIGTSRTFKDDGNIPKPGSNWSFVPWDVDDVKAMIDAGFNYFGTTPPIREYIERQPVFFTGSVTFPDDIYRSNQKTSRMFIDEPMVRLGWDGGIPERPSGPELVAQALRMKVQHEISGSKGFPVLANHVSIGNLRLESPPAPSWETEYWSAWYQLQAGAPGLVHEGRYVHRGYGYDPEHLLGEGLDAFTDRDQFNFFYAFLRGAARSFDGYWGTSIYGQSDRRMRLPAMIRAYDMGAKHLWYWTSDHDHHMQFPEQLRLTRAITEYAERNPRTTDRDVLLKKAEVGIALPPGYAFSWDGTWGMLREQHNSHGVSYGDISAAMAWEGMISSRKGIEFDFLIDHPGIDDLGYERLVIVQEDGSLKVTPPWPEKRAPKNLRVEAVPMTADLISDQQDFEPEFRITRAPDVSIDGDLSEWSGAYWITLDKANWFGDNYHVSATLIVPETDARNIGNIYLGMTYAPLSEELRAKYLIEAWPHEEYVVITDIAPGSPANEAGLREGDMIVSMAGRQTKYTMHIHQIAQQFQDRPGAQLPIDVRRSGWDLYGGDSDLSAEVAFMVDDTHLYFAAKVMDDVHVQDKSGWDLWMHDSVQIGLDPIPDRNEGSYGENNHEIGFALRGGDTVAWRWNGRRGQPIGYLDSVDARIVRRDGVTYYEAAIPLSELAPFAPDTWPRCGINVVINDADEPARRKGRVELAPFAMTSGKHPDRFTVFGVEPSPNVEKVSGGLVWSKRCMPAGGGAEIILGVSSPGTREAVVSAELISLDSPDTRPDASRITVPVSANGSQYMLHVLSDSPPGRYRLNVKVADTQDTVIAEDALNVYVYP